MAPKPDKVKKAKAKKPRVSRSRNYDLGSGLMRFSRARMFKKKAVYLKIKKAALKPKTKVKKPILMRTVKKPIGGDKNGKERLVRVKKFPKFYPLADSLKIKEDKRKRKAGKTAPLKPSLTPGTVCVVLASRHKGKKVVFLKQLKSGLCLVTGPWKINHVPLRRMNQIYLIGTSLKLDVGKLKVPARINDDYFKRVKKAKKTKGEELFDTAKDEAYQVSEQRKKDQLTVDKALIEGIKKREDKKDVFGYLNSMFGLRNGQYPHRLKF